MLDVADRQWLHRLLGAEGVCFDEPMAKHTSFRIGGPADAFVQPKSEAELKAVVKWSQQNALPYLLIGGGTNVLVRDGGIRGLVIHLERLKSEVVWEQQKSDITVTAGAGVSTKRICALALKQGWQGLNFALGIPGTLAGAIIMNAGTVHGAMADIVESVKVMTATGEIVDIRQDSLRYQYRRMQLPTAVTMNPSAPAILLAAKLNLFRGDRDQLRQQARKWMQGRSQRQPAWRPSAGCFFKNPPQQMPAGRLIDDAGFKGRQVGGATVSSRHANFIINSGGASAVDVLTLVAKIQETVKSRFGVDLVPEVCIVGEEKTDT